MLESHAPGFTTEEAAAIAKAHYGIEAEARPLDSYEDQNFRLDSPEGTYVLKIPNAAADDAYVAFQQDVLCHLESQQFSGVPTVVKTRTGSHGATVNGHSVWMVQWLPGRVLAHVNPLTGPVLEDVGRFLGRLDIALGGFDHPQAHRKYAWDMLAAHELKPNLAFIRDADRRALLQGILQNFELRVLPILKELPHSVIHHDGNDHNVLVTGKGYETRVSGLIDFGDALYCCTAAEVAVAATYVMMGMPDPVGAACHVVKGYHSAKPLNDEEISVLLDMVRARLCTSVLHSAHRAAVEPDNEYVQVSEAGAWELLRYLEDCNQDLARYRLRAACGMEIVPASNRLTAWLADHTDTFAAIMQPDMRVTPPAILDLSVASSWTAPPGEPHDPRKASRAWFRRLARKGASIGVGRYNEARLVYTAEHFGASNNAYEESRTIHLGIDLFKEAGTPIYAHSDGIVHSSHYSEQPQGFGGLIILRHWVDELSYFTLFGHLSRESAESMKAGLEVLAGEVIGYLGEPEENGGWIPHLHFQVLADDLGLAHRFPGVAPDSQRAEWLAICPDPNLTLGIPENCFPEAEPSAEEILAQRQRYIGRNLSISYRKPLHIVRGYKQYLYDVTGRRYLDAVNNVPHVGHSHPSVVRAAHRQTPILNTNTRYLHRSLGEYASRLADSMPDPLEVCYFVNSGSEANDLALRLAYAYTRRRHLIVLSGAYHGHLSALIDISPYKFDGPGGSGAPAHVHVAAMPDVYRGAYRDAQAAEKYAAEIAAILAANPGRVAAFISESLLGCGGQLELPPGYLEAVYSSVRAAGGVCIVDEVQVGFGRVGSHFWGFETQNVIPDIVVLGKPMGNGHPLAGVVTTRSIADAFDNGMEFFSTFGGNPVSTAVGMAVLDVIEEENLQENALQTGNWLLQALRELQNDFPIIGDVRGRGLFVGIELVRDRTARQPAAEEASYVANRMAELGVLISTDGPDHNVLKIKPPLAFDLSDAGTLVAALSKVLQEDFIRQ